MLPKMISFNITMADLYESSFMLQIRDNLNFRRSFFNSGSKKKDICIQTMCLADQLIQILMVTSEIIGLSIVVIHLSR